MFGMLSTKREGQTMLNMCMEQCEGVYLMDEIKRLRAEVLKLREELNDLRLSYEVVVAALKEKE